MHLFCISRGLIVICWIILSYMIVKQLFHLGRLKLWLLYTIYGEYKKTGKTPPSADFTSFPLRCSQVYMLNFKCSPTPGHISLKERGWSSRPILAQGLKSEKVWRQPDRYAANALLFPHRGWFSHSCTTDRAHTQISNPKVSLEGGQNARSPTTSLEAVTKFEELLAVKPLRIRELGSPN